MAIFFECMRWGEQINTRDLTRSQLKSQFTQLTPRLLKLIKPLDPKVANSIKLLHVSGRAPFIFLEKGMVDITGKSPVHVLDKSEHYKGLSPTNFEQLNRIMRSDPKNEISAWLTNHDIDMQLGIFFQINSPKLNDILLGVFMPLNITVEYEIPIDA